MSQVPINVLFIVNSLQFGGAEKHVVTLINQLDTRQFNISLLYLKNKTELISQLDVARVNKIICADLDKWLDISAVRRVGSLIDELRTDIVVCTNGYSLAYGVLGRRAAALSPRLIEVFHTTELNGWKQKLQMWLYRPFFRISDLVIFVCNNQRDYWQERKLKLTASSVIHNGINVDYFENRIPAQEILKLRQHFGFAKEDFIVGLCAVMRPEKAHGDLLQAIAELRKRSILVKALLIGDGVERPNIERQIAELDLGDLVKISGFATDVRPYIAACDAMALVSHNVETFSLAALEAMALEKPMVMSRIGGATEQITHGENGFLYEKGDISALANAISQLSDKERCREMGWVARKNVVDNFSLPVMTEKFSVTFKQVFGSKRAAN